MIVETKKHPLVVAIETALPKSLGRYDVQRAWDQGVREAVAALEQALEVQGSKSFGWVIRRPYTENDELKHQYLSSVTFDEINNITGFSFLNSQHNAELFPADFIEPLMLKLKSSERDATYEAIELFTR